MCLGVWWLCHVMALFGQVLPEGFIKKRNKGTIWYKSTSHSVFPSIYRSKVRYQQGCVLLQVIK